MIYRIIAIVWALSIAVNAIAAAVVVVDRTAHAAAQNAVNERIESVHTLASRNDSAGLLTALEAAESDEMTDPAVRDYLLETTLLALSRTSSTLAARTAVAAYENRAVSSVVRLNEAHGQAVVPLYDLAAAARLTIRIWDTRAAHDWVASALRTGQWRPSDFSRPASGLSLDAWQEGTRRAFESVERRFVARQRFTLLQSQNGSSRLDSLLLVAASRLRDADLYEKVIVNGEADYARQAIASLGRKLSGDEVTGILTAGLKRPELASAAILELGQVATNDIEVRGWLLQRLGNPGDGASAALALARLPSNDVLDDIRAVILGNAAQLAKLRAALVLRLSGSPEARMLQQELLSQELSSEMLRRALQ